MGDDGLAVQRTVLTGEYSELIHKRIPCMISYDDELERPHTGFRQTAVIAWGLTKSGNECIRVMQWFGDSRSMMEGEGVIPDYRLLLTKRIKSLKPIQGVNKWDLSDLDSRVNLLGDESMNPCYDHILESDFE